ncbi:hypothetical protein LCGC14_1103100 [marine sediment metagenome]|uniref:Uncharacterized protein n=1 Tax=marine sediment metagenome TaxID=412755 RepID=A0A0F9M8V9_9ZZZZ
MIIAFDIDSEAFVHDDNAINYTVQLMLDSLRCEELEVHGVKTDIAEITEEIEVVWDKEAEN